MAGGPVSQMGEPVSQKHRVEFGLSIRAAREAAGLTQAEVSELTGLAPTHVSAIENGRANVTLETMVRMALQSGHDLQITLIPIVRRRRRKI